MEVNNRFELLASLSVDNEPEEDFVIDEAPVEQKQVINDQQPAKSQWDIPEYVEKPIPCSSIIEEIKTVSSNRKTKAHLPTKNVKPPVEIIDYEEQSDVVQKSEMIDTQTQPTTYTSYPPQPYKFKQKPSSHLNQTMPKFDRKINTLPKYTAVRGNSKACMHKI
ncbi:unnamed protein product [Adineta steineri]|uniref:Uncharacterized protein n=1 Tax=Adineta steineri TaxID=433720 RepID=A0A815FMW5_9BILA|nr:unnamed protein product [Adineta steineri]CAF4081571.1 unnamed protein product [Adineta steineri]